MFRVAISAHLVVIMSLGTVSGKEWARKMFETTDHDFQTVARGAKAEYDFVFENIYKEDIHIARVRSTCNCTVPEITKSTLKTWEKGAIRAKFNTQAFLGNRSATITVVIDKPFRAEVQLTVKGYIRRDVVFSPGSVDFGNVDAGQSIERTVEVKYAGRSNWRIAKVQSPDHYEVQLTEKYRAGGRVAYLMAVRLSPDAPSGYLSDQLVLQTNDSRPVRIPLTVSGRVSDKLTVSPAALSLGVVQVGETVKKQLVVRAKQPFHVTGVRCDDCFSFKKSAEAKKLHLIPIQFTAGNEVGTVSKTIHIDTDLGAGTSASCLATATVKARDEG